LGPNKEERVVFADQVIRINRRLKPERRDFLVSVEAIYLVMRASKVGKNFYKMTRRVPLNQVTSCSLSTIQDNFVVIHVSGEDICIECSHKTEMLAVMLEYREKLNGSKFPLNFNDSISYNVPGGDNRQLRFQMGSGNKAVLKKKAKALTISIGPGAGKDADTAPKGLQRPMGGGGGGRGIGMGGGGGGAVGGGGGGGAAYQQPAAAATQSYAQPAGAAAGNYGQAAGGAAAAMAAAMAGRGGGGGGGAPQPVRPQPAAAAAPAQPRARALYDYSGQTADELSFREGDIIVVHKKDPGGWWEGELNGQRGWIPANYVQEM